MPERVVARAYAENKLFTRARTGHVADTPGYRGT